MIYLPWQRPGHQSVTAADDERPTKRLIPEHTLRDNFLTALDEWVRDKMSISIIPLGIGDHYQLLMDDGVCTEEGWTCTYSVSVPVAVDGASLLRGLFIRFIIIENRTN